MLLCLGSMVSAIFQQPGHHDLFLSDGVGNIDGQTERRLRSGGVGSRSPMVSALKRQALQQP